LALWLFSFYTFYMHYFTSHNPYTYITMAQYPVVSAGMIEQTLQTANTAQRQWKNKDVAERAQAVLQLAQLIQHNHEQLAQLATVEMGKTLFESRLEVLKCSTACEYYAANTQRIVAPTTVTHIDGRKVTTLLEPLGVVLGIFPWNFPYWQIIRSAIPVIMGGNCMIVKPAPNTPQCAIALQDLFNQCGLQEIVQTVFATNEQVAEMIGDARIKACTLTGSEKAGAAVASKAAFHIKKSVLELGGSDPFIVLADANMDLVMENALSARFQNNGQSCIASKRYIVHLDVINEFTDRLKVEMAKLIVGDPMLPQTNIGPLARLDLKTKLSHQVSESLQAGAKIAYQAFEPNTEDCFYPPTILTYIPKNSIAYSEELFGPVLSLYSVASAEEAIALANDTEFGLGASIWSRNTEYAQTLATQIESGQVFINAVTRSNAAFPFGGIKKSGYGREMGEEGLKEFCTIKTIWV
jgi:succinate-semialdehyde dehydrogenase/glutarate-semialdehyde dehydrogenase